MTAPTRIAAKRSNRERKPQPLCECERAQQPGHEATVEARITLGVVPAREDDLEAAVGQGIRALNDERKSLPSLLMVSRDLTKVLNERYPAKHATRHKRRGVLDSTDRC